MKAIITKDDGHAAHLVSNRPVPKLRDGHVLIKTVAVALNPAENKSMAWGLASNDCLVGCDFSGIVEEIGPQVSTTLKKGDRVCGVVGGTNRQQPEDGAFAEYIVAQANLLMKIPESMGFEAAATLPMGVTTVGQGLYQKALKMEIPGESTASGVDGKGKPVLIYGGSSATGALAIQYAKL